MDLHEQQGVNERRNFIKKVTAGAAAVGLGMLGSHAVAEAGDSNKAYAPDDPEAWFNKINGKHRMVFDVSKPRELMPFAWPKVFLLTNQMTGTPEKENSAVVVLRHDAIPYAMENKLWEKYNFGQMFEIEEMGTKNPATKNAFWKPAPGTFKVPGIGVVPLGINELQDSGVMFCVCNMAMTVYSAVAAEKMNKDAAEVKKEWMEGVLPGIQVVPSGVWAVGRAQEHGCGYCLVS